MKKDKLEERIKKSISTILTAGALILTGCESATTIPNSTATYFPYPPHWRLGYYRLANGSKKYEIPQDENIQGILKSAIIQIDSSQKHRYNRDGLLPNISSCIVFPDDKLTIFYSSGENVSDSFNLPDVYNFLKQTRDVHFYP